MTRTATLNYPPAPLAEHHIRPGQRTAPGQGLGGGPKWQAVSSSSSLVAAATVSGLSLSRPLPERWQVLALGPPCRLSLTTSTGRSVRQFIRAGIQLGDVRGRVEKSTIVL